jgi:hypothetical protein
MKGNDKMETKNVLPYMYVPVENDKVVQYEGGQKLRFIVYGAYNAMGLIGTESNGVAILNENELNVVADEIGKTGSFVFSNSNIQVPKNLKNIFNELTSMTFEQVKAYVNSTHRRRYSL